MTNREKPAAASDIESCGEKAQKKNNVTLPPFPLSSPLSRMRAVYTALCSLLDSYGTAAAATPRSPESPQFPTKAHAVCGEGRRGSDLLRGQKLDIEPATRFAGKRFNNSSPRRELSSQES